MLVRTVLLNVQRIVPLPTSVTLGFVMQHLENVSLDVRTAHLEIDVKSDALISTNIARCSTTVSGSPVCDECLFNFYKGSEKCLPCNYGCGLNFSFRLPRCRESDGYCNFGCEQGHYGFMCGLRCSACNNTCHRDTGICESCKYARYCGPTCKIYCNDCCAAQQCEQSCTCSVGCTSTTWGKRCERICNENCAKPFDFSKNICDRSNGSCLHGCEYNNVWGSQCQNHCSSNCVGQVCKQMSGNCTYGCNSTKVYGMDCVIACNKNCVNGTCFRNDGLCDNGCVEGTFGDRCHLSCSENCLGSSCNIKNGYCDFGCNEGYYGHTCQHQCSLGCLYKRCERDGACIMGCIPGWYGRQCSSVCSSKCLQSTCNREDGSCYEYFVNEDTDTIRQLTVVAVSGWLLFMVVAGALVGMVVRRKKNLCCHKKGKDDQEVEINR